MIYLVLSILSGVTNVLSRLINFSLSEKIGSYQSTFFNFLTGLLGSILLFIISNEAFHFFEFGSYRGAWWIYCGGLIGVVCVALQIVLSGRISSFYLTLFLFIGQLFAGAIIDYMVKHELSLYQILGGLLVFAGLSFNLYLDQKKGNEELNTQ